MISSFYFVLLSVSVCFLKVNFWDVIKASGSVMMEAVSLISGDVMELETAWMDLMKWIALVGMASVLGTKAVFPNELRWPYFHPP